MGIIWINNPEMHSRVLGSKSWSDSLAEWAWLSLSLHLELLCSVTSLGSNGKGPGPSSWGNKAPTGVTGIWDFSLGMESSKSRVLGRSES
jgi:hypothetical protein